MPRNTDDEELRELVGEVARAACDERVDEAVDARGDVVLERVDATRCEQRVEQPAVLDVIGRVDREREQGPDVPLFDEIGRREGAGVLEDIVDQCATRRDDGAVDGERAGEREVVVARSARSTAATQPPEIERRC
jgi:hypothetical protein